MTDYTFSVITLRSNLVYETEYRREIEYCLNTIADRLGRDVPEDEAIPLSVWWEQVFTQPPYMWWSLRCLGSTGHRIGVGAACKAARRVLPLVRGDRRPACLSAIEAAEGVLLGTVTKDECRNAYTVVVDFHDLSAAVRVAAYAAAAAYCGSSTFAAYLACTGAACAAKAYIEEGEDTDVFLMEREQQRADLHWLAFGQLPEP